MYLPVIFYGDRWKIADGKMDAIHLKIQLTFGVLDKFYFRWSEKKHYQERENIINS